MTWYTKAIVIVGTALFCFIASAAHPGTANAASSVTPCPIQFSSCMTRLDDLLIEFDIMPKPVTTMSEHTFIVTISRNGAPVTDAAVQVNLTMPGMFMGTNRPELTHIAKGRYEGRGMFMRCASGKKNWQADVMIGQGVGTTTAGFKFDVR